MESSTHHSQPLLQDNSDNSDDGQDDDVRDQEDDTITETLDKELLRGGQSAPHDKYSFNYIIFYLMGMTTLLPWNFFITAEDVSFNRNISFIQFNFCNVVRNLLRADVSKKQFFFEFLCLSFS